ncbi:MAG: PAS domain-containing hybrid sensor histidine kinase/response regulator [Bacteroidetes bacterium]|nr:MAG: PAS domain-containing hybrid sensor histidine kinase/response regulator [Bacteroidota bacterium]
MWEYFNPDEVSKEINENHDAILHYFLHGRNPDVLKNLFAQDISCTGDLQEETPLGYVSVIHLFGKESDEFVENADYEEVYRKVLPYSAVSGIVVSKIKKTALRDSGSDTPLASKTYSFSFFWQKNQNTWHIKHIHYCEAGQLKKQEFENHEKKLTRDLWKSKIELSESLKELNEFKSYFQIVFEEISDGILVLNPEDEHFLMANKNLCTLLGYSSEELKKLWFTQILSDEFAAGFSEKLKNIAEKEFSFEGVELKARDGKSITTDLACFKVDYKESLNVICIFSDKSYEKKTIAVQKEAETAQKASESKNLFLANMSHEIRTPVTGIIGMSEILFKTELDPRQAEYLQILNESSRLLLRLINNILDISKIEAGKLELKIESFNIQSAINNIKKLNHPELINKNNEMQVEIDSGVPESVIADKLRVEQVLMNLVNNAMKFTENGVIKINASIPDNSDPGIIKISVTDTGIGINEEDQTRLFHKFQQIDNSMLRPGEGSGLGLYICKQLVSYLGGEIGVESNPGKGSCFWFTFRSHTEKNNLVKESAEPENEEDDIDVSLNLSILLVDDKTVNLQVISLMLQAADCKVELAKNGIEALEKFKPEIYDVILMDIMMPVMDGVAAMKELRKMHDKLPPIIAITANAMAGDKEKYLKEGFDGYITKPVTTRKLVSELLELSIIVKNGI